MASRPTNARSALLELGARLFEEPDRIVVVRTLRLSRTFRIALHSHPDWLQLSLHRRCTGRFFTDNADIPVRGVTALTFYPKEPHGHELIPVPLGAGEDSVIKIRVEPHWPAVRHRLFREVTYDPVGEVMLLRAVARLMRLITIGEPGPIAVSRLMEVLCLWPSREPPKLVPDAVALADAELDEGLRAALTAIDARLDDPPSLAELGGLAHLSTRHFVRKFRQAMGVTPHDLIAARRLDRAKDLLSGGDLTIAEVADALGFTTPSAFSRWFVQRAGASPSAFREPRRMY